MDSAQVTASSLESVEAGLRDGLARGDAVLSTATPILRHLLASEDRGLFSDEVVARVRGMLTDIARQLLFAHAETTESADRAAFAEERSEKLVAALAADAGLLGHLHALTIEARFARRMQERAGIDPVLSPLLQELVATSDEAMAAAAMSSITAQARFVQQQQRMALPIGELPGDLFHAALVALQKTSGEDETVGSTLDRLRGAFDESLGRIGLFTRLCVRMGKGADRALDIGSAGLSLFATALAMAAGQDRSGTVLAFSDRQPARLALSLRAAGLREPEIEAQVLHFDPETTLPEGFDGLSPEQAAVLLAASHLGTED